VNESVPGGRVEYGLGRVSSGRLIWFMRVLDSEWLPCDAATEVAFRLDDLNGGKGPLPRRLKPFLEEASGVRCEVTGSETDWRVRWWSGAGPRYEIPLEAALVPSTSDTLAEARRTVLSARRETPEMSVVQLNKLVREWWSAESGP
jgi:hypothetical protein